MTAAAIGFQDIESVLTTYFEGLYRSDADRLAAVFHPAALYITQTPDGTLHRDLPTYLDVVAHRTSPAARGEPRNDRVVSITQVAPSLIVAVVECSLGDVDYLDVLTLLDAGGRWQIVTKAFHATARRRAEEG
ncbi:hypothetical protein BJY16_005614 [Actinoplanes octamycinicus]|uniref:Lumazine-binding protein n=1 Tax=Actinoplanes octamycinicus TaxID=135948 RepID=A0A7W7M9U0_9ACTN|nr:nuclear transport factor 2 family protein [Actinoplanes octamycinicus]MBB4742155.1 hypothetical protein [Actinoplanes octamycinicus]GIE59999.1 hypothetical protein Aoc01nite_54010 [Actinoplanes octamycinicus]